MTLPELLSGAVGDEDVVARVPLGGDDLLAITPTRTLVYRADGLLSDESVEEYRHAAERIAVSTGRRKSKLVLGYGLDGDETLSLPTKRVDDVLHPVLAGVLSAAGVTEPGESVRRTFRFSELTLVVTDRRVVKHVGSAVWDEEFEEFPYADLTDLDFEEGTVATAIVLAHDGRSERFKAPNESARAVRETLVDAVCDFHDVESLEEFRVTAATEDEDASDGSPGEGGSRTGTTDFGEGPDPLSASPAADAEAEETDPELGIGTESDATREEGSLEDRIAPDVDEPLESARDGSAQSAESSGREPTTSDPLAGDFGVDASVESGSASGSGSGSEPGAETVAGAETDQRSGSNASGSDGVDRSDVTGASPGAGSTDTDPVDGGIGGDSDVDEDPATPDAFEGSAFESAGVEDDDLAAEVASLRAAVEAQSDRLERQSELIERLITELRRGR